MPSKFTLSACAVGALFAVLPVASAADVNIAEARPYRFSPANAAGRDAPGGVLTNGKFSPDPIWGDKGETLQFRGHNPFSVTFDLKERQPIDGVAISSAAGVATSGKDVMVWPGAVDLYVSDDNRVYYHVGELLGLHEVQQGALPEFGQYARRLISARGLQSAGRYLKLVFSKRRDVYLDEVQVFRGEESLLKLSAKGEGIVGEEVILGRHDLKAPDVLKAQPEINAVEQAKRDVLNEAAIRRRYFSDVDTLLSKADALPKEKGQPIRERLLKLREAAASQPVKLLAKNTLPAGDIGRAILAEQAAIWRAAGKDGIAVWPSDHWGFLRWLSEPVWEAKPKLAASILRGETRSFSLNVSNASDREATLDLRLKDIPSDLATIAVHSVEWTESPWRLAVSSALPNAVKEGEGYRITVPAGGTRQIWFTARGEKESGSVEGSMELLEGGKLVAAAPVSVTVYPISFPAEPALRHGGFECATNGSQIRRFGVFREALPAFVETLRANGVNAPWGTRAEFAFGKFNAEHRYASADAEPSTATLRDWTTKYFPGAYRYHIALTVRTPDRRAVIDGCDYAKDPEGFQQRVNTWLGFWKKEIEALGLKPEQFFLKLIDEPGFDSSAPYIDDEVILIWARAIHRSGTGFKVFINPIYQEPWGASKEMLDEADVLCIKYSHLLRFGERYRDFYLSRKGKQEISIYECYGAPGHLYDPYSYFRLQAWMAWDIGASTMFFWNYADSGTGEGWIDSWNTGNNHWYYTPLFLSPDSVVTSKQMEAIREGAADFQVLALLRDTADRLRNKGDAKAAVQRADQLLRRVSAEVLAGNALEEPRWMWPNAVDRSPADRLREEAQRLLVELSAFDTGK